MGLVNKIVTRAATKASGKLDNILDELITKTPSKEKSSIADTSTKYEKTEILPESKRSKNFQKKFKQTKVLDENKRPAVMYHGRTTDFDKFDTTGGSSPNREIGIHLGSSEQANTFASEEGGNVVPMHLDVKNPLRLHDYGSFTPDDVLEQLRSEGFDESIIDSIDDLPFDKKGPAVIDLIKSKGYDGIVYLNRREGLNIKGSHDEVMSQLDEIADYDDKTLREEYGAKDSYVIFDPSQAKSVFNKGTYSESDDRFNYNKGGDVNNQTEQLFADGGVMQEGGTVDPVSGNDVPPGAMQEEVRDDVDAKLSEGEFVIPADVVRYIGLETLMKLRDKAKAGLARMEEIGQMGNAEAVPDAEALHGGEDVGMDDNTFSSEIDSIMSEDEPKQFAEGGYVAQTDADLNTPVYNPNAQSTEKILPSNKELYADAPIKGFEMVPMVNDEGQIIYIPFINGVAQLEVPKGYKVKTEDTKTEEKKKTEEAAPAQTPAQSTGGDGGSGSGTSDGGIPGTPAANNYGGITAAPNATLAGMVGGFMLGPVGSIIGKYALPALVNAGNSTAIGTNLGYAGYSQEAINAAQIAASQEASKGGSPGSIAAAAAQAAAAADGKDPLDAMFSVTNNFGTTNPATTTTAPSGFGNFGVSVDYGLDVGGGVSTSTGNIGDMGGGQGITAGGSGLGFSSTGGTGLGVSGTSTSDYGLGGTLGTGASGVNTGVSSSGYGLSSGSSGLGLNAGSSTIGSSIGSGLNSVSTGVSSPSTSSSSSSSSSSAPSESSNNGGFSYGDTSDSGYSSDTGYSGGGGWSSSDSVGGWGGYAKGGLVQRRPKKQQKGIASRKK